MFKLTIYGKKDVNWIFRVLPKMIIDTKLKFLGKTIFLMGYRMIYHTLLLVKILNSLHV